MQNIILKKGKERSLDRGHRWIFSGAIDTRSNTPDSGSLVRIETDQGRFIGIGHYHRGSIAVRIITFTDEPIDASFWKKRLADAAQLRQSVGLPSDMTNCFRFVHAEGDGLPGCIIDLYASCAVIQTHTSGMANHVQDIADAVLQVLGTELSSVLHRNVADGTHHVLHGKVEELIVKENGLLFKVDPVNGQKTGFFLDQRENRALVGQLATGKTVLNTFSYTGGFSIYALANGAEKVVSVDVSQSAIDMANANAELNHVSERHEAIAMDAFKYLEQADSFDMVILDPPAFAKSIKARHRAVQGYKRLNETALRRIAPNGLLFTFSCSQVVGPELFENTVLAAAINAGRSVRVLKRLGHQPDHPINIFHPEGEYLKGLLLYVS